MSRYETRIATAVWPGGVDTEGADGVNIAPGTGGFPMPVLTVAAI
jgi:hypothetical protein